MTAFVGDTKLARTIARLTAEAPLFIAGSGSDDIVAVVKETVLMVAAHPEFLLRGWIFDFMDRSAALCDIALADDTHRFLAAMARPAPCGAIYALIVGRDAADVRTIRYVHGCAHSLPN